MQINLHSSTYVVGEESPNENEITNDYGAGRGPTSAHETWYLHSGRSATADVNLVVDLGHRHCSIHATFIITWIYWWSTAVPACRYSGTDRGRSPDWDRETTPRSRWSGRKTIDIRSAFIASPISWNWAVVSTSETTLEQSERFTRFLPTRRRWSVGWDADIGSK